MNSSFRNAIRPLLCSAVAGAIGFTLLMLHLKETWVIRVTGNPVGTSFPFE